MKHYFKKKSDHHQGTGVVFGAYEESNITERGDILCKDIVEMYHDYGTDNILLYTEAGYFEPDEIESISVEEYTKAVSTFEFVKELEEKLFKTLI